MPLFQLLPLGWPQETETKRLDLGRLKGRVGEGAKPPVQADLGGRTGHKMEIGSPLINYHFDKIN